MAVFQCKMCGGKLDIIEGSNICECPYCNTKQTVPLFDDDRKTALFTRANHLRAACDFDKAASVYENIVAEFPEESEAYWGLCLCRYGIEYVDDPVTGRKVPTCHRTAVESIFDYENFEQANEYATADARDIYYAEAKEIDRIQKNILEIVKNEEPYDVFICYKETDENNERTKDSVLAQDIYNALTREGYKVFFSRITLEDKLGVQYEPYIFAALTSSKVMLVVGTHRERFNAVWVKNEWTRFLDMRETDSSKVLIPCYADIDAYDMPREFKNLQGQDLGKIGAIQDLLRGIGKIIQKDNGKAATAVTAAALNIPALLERAFMFLASSDFESADKFCERVLDQDPKNGRAYLGKLLSEFRCPHEQDLGNLYVDITESPNYRNALQFGCDLKKYGTMTMYNRGCRLLKNAETVKQLETAKAFFSETNGYADSAEKYAEVSQKLDKAAAITDQFKAVLARYDEKSTGTNQSDALKRLINHKNSIKLKFPKFGDGKVTAPFNPAKVCIWLIAAGIAFLSYAFMAFDASVFSITCCLCVILGAIAGIIVRKKLSLTKLIGSVFVGIVVGVVVEELYIYTEEIARIVMLIGIAMLVVGIILIVVYCNKTNTIYRYRRSLNVLEQLKENLNTARNSEIQAVCAASYDALGEPLVNDCLKKVSVSYDRAKQKA